MKESTKVSKSQTEVFSNFVIFKIDSAKVNVDVLFQDETLWLTQKQIAELFEKGRSTITEHLKKIFEEGELDEKVVCRHIRHTTKHGAISNKTQTKTVKYYNLRAIVVDNGKVSDLQAKLKAEAEYEKYRVEQDRLYVSDFDKLIMKMEKKK